MRLFIDSRHDDSQRRAAIYAGGLYLYQPAAAWSALAAHARALITSAFAGQNPLTAQHQMPVEDFVETIASLKTRFTNDATTKSLLQELLRQTGHHPTLTYFDVPRLRVVTSDNYLTAGVGYAYKAHRDTWYAAPQCQINWWLPLFDLEDSQTLLFFPEYFGRALENTSAIFTYDEWQQRGRPAAKAQIHRDTRPHPLPLVEVDEEEAFRMVMPAEYACAFSSAQLHATATNTSGETRFSLDFRTFHRDDLQAGVGAPNVDTAAGGSKVSEFLQLASLEPFGAEYVRH